MVDGLTGRPQSRRILPENKVEVRKRVVSRNLTKERGCTKNKKTKTSMYLMQKQVTEQTALNNKSVQNENKKAENYHTATQIQNAQKRCKKVVVKLRREDLIKVVSPSKEKGQQLSVLNGEVARPNTRRIRISYKPKEYKPKCTCGCALALQDQCAVDESKNPKTNPQVKTSIKKVAVRLKRIKVGNTTRSQANTKLKNVMVKVKRIRNTNILGNIDKENENDVDPKVLEISRFSPVRNSTVFEMGEEALPEVICDDKTQNLSKDTENISENRASEISLTKETQKKNSLTNNPNLIEQILCNDNEDVNEQPTHISEDICRTTNQTKANTNRTHKFFHRIPAIKLRSRKTSIERKRVFEFLSPSDNSESEEGKHVDPAADIINKLIAQGKVRVATNHKGTGRPILKRIRRKETANKNKIRKINSKKIATVASTAKPTAMNESNNIDNANEHLPPVPAAHFEYEDDNPSAHYDDEPRVEYTNDGGFSNLARSVLLQQTRKNEITRKKDVAERRRLLEIARKFVSTPAVKRQNESVLDLSPIQHLTVQRSPACPSPWRINEDAHLPRVFNFSKNNSYLPTFSSDYIPPSPKKVNPNNSTHIYAGSNAPASATVTAATNKTNTKSSCSSHTNSTRSTNDSNVENMPPPPVSNSSVNASNNDENADIFNLRQLPNPRRTLQHRTPLKAINIIEVVSLPPWKSPINYDADKNKTTNSDKSTTTNSSKGDDKHNADELFGFEELINDDLSEVEDPLSINNATTTPDSQSIKQDLHNKLKNLKKWRPKNTAAHNKPSSTPVKSNRLFDDDEDRPKQRLIKEMLCSTMINPINALPAHGNVHDGGGDALPIAKSYSDQPSEAEGDIFNDYEPNATFNDKQCRQTYARPVRQKRKIRKNVVRFLDSDEDYNSSDADDGEQQQKQKDKKIKELKKMRHDTQVKAKNNVELESFVNEFNSMCKEVDRYELIVE